MYFFIRKRSIASVRQRLFVIRVEARVVLQRAGLAEVHAVKYRIRCGGLGQDKVDLGILAYEANIKLAVFIRIVERCLLYTSPSPRDA